MDLVFYGFAVLLFAACILMVEGAWLWWSGTHGGGAQRIAKRLRLMAARGDGGGERVSILKQRRYAASARLDHLLRRLPNSAALDRLLLQSGLKWSVAQVLAWSLLLLLPGLLLPRAFGMPPLAALLFAALALASPCMILLRARSGRLHKIEAQLPEAADFLARALRAGHSFSNVLQMVGDELTEPLSGEFKTTYEEINYGVPMNEALHNLAMRIPLTDLRYLVIAVLIQRESGGNLAEVLNSIARIIRARLKLLGQVRVLSAEGRMSAWVLGLMPVVMILVMSVVNPHYISLLWTDPTGIRLLWYAAGMVALGVVWMRKVIRIRV
ncbi:type II secretion system F family protein [Janthinobacterium agaricidamnosum]|uniref:Bacterial type II secretion system F domain protein n=1 Tax=Janthinobacterium agaricidamnosum NBRC 102515 = DSM 9628 TaxID=1349767 RepID=W0VDF4_9BURK|nr:type II secretion system F family protein [Janthinobacterium agaricidamnosum]CDG85695.1 bacterial type II secretion system F domain protein [Janthinobacterium agaricidamnosum NBRC 102515 = DSM 9628]